MRLIFFAMMTDSLQQIVAAMQAGNFSVAGHLARTALEISPDDMQVMVLFATSLHYQHRIDEALPIYERLLELEPNSSVHWGNYGTALHEANRLDEAVAAFKKALQHPPIEANTLLNYGLLLMRQESWLEARDVLLSAHARDRESGQIALAAAKACNVCRDYRIDQLIANWRDWLPLEDDAQLDLARLLFTNGHSEAARGLIEAVSQRAPQNLQASIQLANAYERLNRLTDAEALLVRIGKIHTDLDVDTQREIERLRASLAMRCNDPALAKKLLTQAGTRSRDDVEYYFDLAKACDSLGETGAAMQALVRGHEEQIRKIVAVTPHLLEPDAPVFSRTAGLISAEEFATWPLLIAPERKQSPIFVVGFPRSGTTLLEQMLDAHPALQSMDERPFFNILADQLEEFGARIPQDLAGLSQEDCDELRKGYVLLACAKIPRCWNTQLVDKNPLNMLWLPMIHRLYPNAKWIFALRHPCDVILSCYLQNFRSNVLASACADLERLATGYVEAMQHWLHHMSVFRPDVQVMRYEDLVADAPGQLAAIAKFLELDDAAPMLGFSEHARQKGFIATPSYTEVIKPVSSASVGRWTRYRDYFEPILKILAPMLEHWEYTAAN